MPLSYAGVNLPVCTPEVAALLEQRLNPKDLYPWADDLTSGSARINWTVQGRPAERRPVKIGSLYWPTGASRWAEAYFLVDDSSLASIRSAITPGSPAPLVMDDGNKAITAQMIMLPARPLHAIIPGSSLWLLVLVDQRYYLWQTNTQDITVTASGVSSTVMGVWSATWANLYAAAAANSGITLTADIVPSVYSTPAPALTVHAERVPPYLDTIAYNLGQRMVFGLDGKIAARNQSTSQQQYTANLAANSDILAGGELALTSANPADTAALLPGHFVVDFPTADRASNASGWAYSPALQPHNQRVTINLSSLGFGSGIQANSKYHRVRTTAWAAMTGNNWGPPTPVWDNLTTCTALATQIATDWYASQLSPADLMFAGIADWIPEGLSDSIEWTYREDMVCTRVQRPPYNDPCENLFHFLGLWPQPYPTIADVVTTSATQSSITLQNGTGSTAYPGLFNLGAFDTTQPSPNQSPIWVQLSPDANAPGFLDVGVPYHCELIGEDFYGQRIYQIIPGFCVGHAGGFPPNSPTRVLIGDTTNVISFTTGGPGQDVITVAPASATAWGVVTTTTQTFAGNKTINGNLSAVHVVCTDVTGNLIGGLITAPGGTISLVSDFILSLNAGAGPPCGLSLSLGPGLGAPASFVIGAPGQQCTITTIDPSGGVNVGATSNINSFNFVNGLYCGGGGIVAYDGGTW